MARTKEFSETEALDKALEIFWQKGYNATSANDLVNELGLSRSSIYSTFTDKRTLFIKALKRYSQINIENVLEEVKQSDNIPETIAAVFNKIITQDETAQISKGCFIVNTGIELAAHDMEIAEIVNHNKVNVESVLKVAIKKGQNLGQITKAYTPEMLARFIFNNVSGLRVAIRSNNDKKELKQVINMCLSILNKKVTRSYTS